MRTANTCLELTKNSSQTRSERRRIRDQQRAQAYAERPPLTSQGYSSQPTRPVFQNRSARLPGGDFRLLHKVQHRRDPCQPPGPSSNLAPPQNRRPLKLKTLHWNNKDDSRILPLPEQRRPRRDVARFEETLRPGSRITYSRRSTALREELRVKKRRRLESEARFKEKLHAGSHITNFRRSTTLREGLRISKRRRFKSEARFEETQRPGDYTTHLRRSIAKSTPNQDKTNRPRGHSASRMALHGNRHSAPAPSSSNTRRGGRPSGYSDADHQGELLRHPDSLFPDRSRCIIMGNSVS